MKLFKICTSNTEFKNAKSYKSIPQGTLFVKFVTFIHDDMNCNFLSKKIQRWFNDNSGKTEKDFSFRFRGKESFSYMKHFMCLIEMILANVSSETVKSRLHQVYYQSVHLRKLLSYTVRIVDLNTDLLKDMKLEGQLLFKSSCMFDQRISPSLWTVCNAAPVHAGHCFQHDGGQGAEALMYCSVCRKHNVSKQMAFNFQARIYPADLSSGEWL